MTFTQKNILMSGWYTRKVLSGEIAAAPNGRTIIFIPEDDPELEAFNRGIAEKYPDAILVHAPAEALLE